MASASLKTYIDKSLAKVKAWISSNKLEFLILILILSVGAYFRLYRISEYMTFLGDEGRDAIIVRRLLVDFDLILIGPRTSIGDMYLGPLYYYLIAPALLLANFSPAGPSFLVALIGIATVFFVWFAGREWFPPKASQSGGQVAWGALVAAMLYAISPTVIVYSKSSWNPNIMPFFALLSVYSMWKVYRDKKFGWLIVLSIAMAFVLQSHYLGLLLVPTLGFFWLLSLVQLKREEIRGQSSEVRKFTKYSALAFLIIVILMSPLVIFDARHGWNNFESIKRFFLERQTTVSARPWTAFPKLPEVTDEMFTSLVVGKNEVFGNLFGGYLFLWVLAAVTTLLIYIIIVRRKLFKIHSSFLMLILWIGVGLVGLALYKQEIYEHYYGFFFPAPYLLIGGIIQFLLPKKFSIRHLVLGFSLIYLFFVNLSNNPLKYPPNRQLQRSIEVSEKIIEEAGGNKFNLAVIAERNYEGAYQYFLEKEDAPIFIIDPQKAEETITNQLYVVCELPPDKCDPVNNPKAEVANFGWSKIQKEWHVAGVILYKLVPNK